MFPISDSVKSKRFPFINFILIAITVFVWFLQISTPDFEGFIYRYALVPSSINFSDFTTLYPFITSMFLHGGWLHIISNMWFLWVFGDNVEGELGHLPYLFLYIVAGLVGGFAQFILSPDSTIPMLGASGAVAGALGAYYRFFPHHKIKTLIPVFGFITFTQVNASFMLGYWLVLQIISGFVSLPMSGSEQGGVAFWAHIGGFIAGMLIGRILAPTEKRVLEGEIIN